MSPRREAAGWAVIYTAAILAAVAGAQDAHAHGYDAVETLLFGYGLALLPIYKGLVWDDLVARD